MATIRLQIPADSDIKYLPTFNNPFTPHEPRFKRENGRYICDVEPLELAEWLDANEEHEAAEKVRFHIDCDGPRRLIALAKRRLDEKIVKGERDGE